LDLPDTDRIWTPREIRERYEAGEREFGGLDISEAADAVGDDTFRGALLDRANFSRAFIFADFAGASLVNCRFVEANVKTCRFDRANLDGCDFSDAAIDAATFSAASAVGAVFAGATAYGATLGADETPAKWDSDG
jgi:uncharacterized protein YjbI with pentapeptide repeats